MNLFGSLADRDIGLIGHCKPVWDASDRRLQIRHQPVAIARMNAAAMRRQIALEFRRARVYRISAG